MKKLILFALTNFKEPIESLYIDKNICVSSTIKEYNGNPGIIIAKPEDITIE